MDNVIIDTKQTEIEEVFPYTRAGAQRRALMHPTIILRDDTGERYVLSGMKVLYSLLNQMMDTYYRTTVRDHLYNGPTDQFIDRLRDEMDSCESLLVLNLCGPQEYESQYGKVAMVNTRTPANDTHNIVQTVSSLQQDSTLNHITNVLKENTINWKYVGTRHPDNGYVRATTNQRGYHNRVAYQFIKTTKSGREIGRVNITVSPSGSMMAEVWYENPNMDYEISPFDSLLKMTEQDPKYLGPWLLKIDQAAHYAFHHHEPTLAKETWEREVGKFEGTESEIGSTRRMLWRNKALKYSFGCSQTNRINGGLL
tara:strand:+ start:804 stop:1736 length:933 start_codon:yes stop_codon:yes gene_type:complete